MGVPSTVDASNANATLALRVSEVAFDPMEDVQKHQEFGEKMLVSQPASSAAWSKV